MKAWLLNWSVECDVSYSHLKNTDRLNRPSSVQRYWHDTNPETLITQTWSSWSLSSHNTKEWGMEWCRSGIISCLHIWVCGFCGINCEINVLYTYHFLTWISSPAAVREAWNVLVRCQGSLTYLASCHGSYTQCA